MVYLNVKLKVEAFRILMTKGRRANQNFMNPDNLEEAILQLIQKHSEKESHLQMIKIDIQHLESEVLRNSNVLQNLQNKIKLELAAAVDKLGLLKYDKRVLSVVEIDNVQVKMKHIVDENSLHDEYKKCLLENELELVKMGRYRYSNTSTVSVPSGIVLNDVHEKNREVRNGKEHDHLPIIQKQDVNKDIQQSSPKLQTKEIPKLPQLEEVDLRRNRSPKLNKRGEVGEYIPPPEVLFKTIRQRYYNQQNI